MIILIKYHDTTIALDVNPSDRIETIKELIFKRKGYKADVDLLYEGANLEDEKTLSDYNIHNLSILHWHDLSYELITKFETCIKELTEKKDKAILEIIEDYALATNLSLLCTKLIQPNQHFFDLGEKVRLDTIIRKFLELKKSLDTAELDGYLIKYNLIDFKSILDIDNIDNDDNNEKCDDDEDKETVDDENNDDNVLDESSSNKEEKDDIYKCIINKKPRKHSV